ncbi:MAG: hypothetical protein UV78_C0041G0008 [Parcubacteria group bacterium GW2011_GWA2_43_17]|nr:MAG: hypothetical protein UV78_C0041G0008 [Parcubacteria group bacterium GW2011_GWA2_43_17]KKT94457.1 MAG: hypothetical protein UW91_C0001G0021 [Parcubacteria group bacterium GW2011_GWF2_45_11]KKT96403.1 MAG: hypothetical protein UW98_C0044G0002 [Parcubacteria group bacterium GW2011_GWC2_45_15]OGY92593.1 MAG: hypothetical protein A2260_01505 [Candidatus Komeilibacteria bacterium RIFOXYA2_FULL_45_9]OGY93798.1 MAG: hypothetical protein A3J95_01915 [Candidatus Komeilibacteria bacterium RIFOXYC2
MTFKLPIVNLIKYAVLLIILVLVVLLLVSPNYNSLKNINLTLTAEAEALESKYTAGAGVEKFSQAYQSYYDKLPEYESLFIETGDELSLVTKLEELADKFSLNQKLDLGVNNTALSGHIIQVPFNFVISGTFDNFLQYLKALHQMPYNLTIQNIDVKQSGDARLEVKLLGYTYWLKAND